MTPIPKDPRFQNLSGIVFGNIKVSEYFGQDRTGHKQWVCLCPCGKHFIADGGALKRFKYQSCGCRKGELIGFKKTTHGHAKKGVKSHEYSCWKHAKDRVSRPLNKRFKDYGGRGISMCERWFNSFSNFLSDMGMCPEGMTLDRKDNDGNYEPGNCRWATIIEQANNKRNNVILSHNGRTQSVRRWEKELGFNNGVIDQRMRAGWEMSRLFEPLNH